MAQKGDLMTVRSDIQILDATIRDGGLVNNFDFSEDFINALYRANVKAGVDYMEFGYKASKELFDPDKFGKWKFCEEEDIRKVVGENNSDLKISVMADVGRCDYKKDIIDRKDSVIDMVRVATYVHQMPAAIDMIEDAKAKLLDELANEFINYIHKPENYAKFLDFFCFPDYIIPEAQQYMKTKPHYDASQMDNCVLKLDIGEDLDKYNERWQDIRFGD